MTPPRDRLGALILSTTLNGIDFVTVDAVDPRTLYVHFVNATDITSAKIGATITRGDSVPVVPVAPVKPADWSLDAEGRPLLTLHALIDGDFSDYLLTLAIPAADPQLLDIAFAASRFSFKANCPSDFDCAPPPVDCPPDDTVVPPIDYLAKDFLSFRRALLDFSALRYPAWVERSEADFGVMFAEALSAMVDDLSYLQDRVAGEAMLETATQRRSLTSLARLVDYEPRPATSATTWLQLTASAPGTAAPGLQVIAAAPDGGQIPFEVGEGLGDATAKPVSDVWNHGIAPYWFDDNDRCLPAGSTALWVAGHGFGFVDGQAILIQTDLPGDSQRRLVHLMAIAGVVGFEAIDPLFGNAPVTRITWRIEDALDRAIDLTRTTLGGNIVRATQGARVVETFAIGTAPATAPGATLAIARRGPNGDAVAPNWVHRYPLVQGPLAWLSPADGGIDTGAAPMPELRLAQVQPIAQDWDFAPSLLQVQSTDLAVTIDPVLWRAVGFSQTGAPTHFDIDGDAGSTVRFGDDTFGAAPAEQDLFAVTYRVGVGAAGNVAVDTITQVVPAGAGVVTGARNPFAVTDGADAESRDQIVRRAPQAFRAKQFRAVRPEDYEGAAESLPWVQKAGTAFRWTGSWLTVFTAVDPQGGEAIGLAHEIELVELLNRRRLAGYESYAPPPQYLSLDLKIAVCALPGWLDGDVEAGVLERLGSAARAYGAAGFFFADRFTFGLPLYRSRLEAAIQAVPGVLGVHGVTYRQRGSFGGFVDLPEVLAPSTRQILRVDNDPSWPERGTIRVTVEGGR
ncbi:baseplate J/gp47 family protein [Novosphingobium lentum]|uniref:baseplate J/gp47 family protein n=1 Tax=Novosphingobium lentum TaxID=145287 RepID=UPI000836AB12|nr:baseplate J/gp47 family protein [Novosphingobium lentum]